MRPGTILRGYRIKDFLARGGMADLYTAEPAAGPLKDLVLKLYRWDDSLGDALLPVFQSAGQMLRGLRHPALPVISEYFSMPGGFVIVQEYIPGKDLERLGDEMLFPFPAGQVIGWGIEICIVLGYLHARIPPVILRDLRPSNLVLDGHKRLRVIDLELASTEHGLCDLLPPGVPGYVPPEVMEGEKISPANDLYSLGATLFYLLTLKKPSPENVKMLEGKGGNIPAGLAGIILKALNPEPEKRFRKAGEMERELRGFEVSASKRLCSSKIS